MVRFLATAVERDVDPASRCCRSITAARSGNVDDATVFQSVRLKIVGEWALIKGDVIARWLRDGWLQRAIDKGQQVASLIVVAVDHVWFSRLIACKPRVIGHECMSSIEIVDET
jgi:hypothetical protein